MKTRHILVLAIVAALTGCSGGDDAATGGAEEKSMVEKAAEGAKEVAGKAVDGAKGAATAVVEGTKDAASAAVDATKDAAGAAVDKAKEVAGDAAASVKEAASGAAASVKEAASNAVESAKGAVAAATGGADGAKLYTACAGCHGARGDMKALNVAPLLAGQSKEDVAKKIHGYKDGSYGGPMKGVMATQVTKLSDADIEALADYISKF